jgi:hypothetical protein
MLNWIYLMESRLSYGKFSIDAEIIFQRLNATTHRLSYGKFSIDVEILFQRLNVTTLNLKESGMQFKQSK